MKELMISSIMTFVLMLGAIFAVGVIGTGILMLIMYLMVKDGTKAAFNAIERFFGPGCKVSTGNHSMIVRQVVPILEIGTARGEFDHSYGWKKQKLRVLGIPIPLTEKEAECRHSFLVTAGFDLKTQVCRFDFLPVNSPFSLLGIFSPKSYNVKVTVPRAKILSVETTGVKIEDRSGWFDFWNALTEKDRHDILDEMFAQTRSHVERTGRGLLIEAMQRLEGGLRTIMPQSVRSIEFVWMENTSEFDFALSGTEKALGQ